MSSLSVTLIDVGWGDSILIEYENNNGKYKYALIDSNDTTYLRSSYIFLKRYFEKKRVNLSNEPTFDFVILSHSHADHGQGLKAILREFGTKNFWYPKSSDSNVLGELIRYSNRSDKVSHHQSIDNTKILPELGDVNMEVLWPPRNQIASNENNNSIVLVLTLNHVSFALTGDAEGEVWSQIANRIPGNTRFFKVPHHGSSNGTFDNNQHTPWLDHCSEKALLGISSHVRPFEHPDQEVIDLFDQRNIKYFRTDLHYHVTFQTDGTNVTVKYSHE